MRKYFTCLIVLFGLTTSLARADYAAGLSAYKKKDYTSAVGEFVPLANKGDRDAQFMLGWMFREGHGVVQDPKEAAKWFRLAAIQGDADAQLKLGMLLYSGLGVTRNYDEAMKWYRLAAASQGNSAAQAAQGMLALMFYNGNGVPKDLKEAFKS